MLRLATRTAIGALSPRLNANIYSVVKEWPRDAHPAVLGTQIYPRVGCMAGSNIKTKRAARTLADVVVEPIIEDQDALRMPSTPPPKRPRKRVAVNSPAEVYLSEQVELSPAVVLQSSTAVVEPESEQPAKRTRKRTPAKSKTSAQAQVDATDQTIDTPAAVQQATEQPPTKGARRGRAKKSEPVVEAVQQDNEASEEVSEEPKKPARRTRAKKAAAADNDDQDSEEKPAKPAKKPRAKSKATIGQEVAAALNASGHVDPVAMLHVMYPHTKTFELPVLTASALAAAAQASNSMSQIEHNMTRSDYSTVLTYRAAETILTTPSMLPPAGALLNSETTSSEDKTVTNMAPPSQGTDIAENEAASLPRDEDELPAAVKDLVLGHAAASGSDGNGKVEETLPLEDAEALPPLPLELGFTEDAPDPEFNKLHLRNKPWPSVLPNLGYACLNATLRYYGIFSSRDCNEKTFVSRGLSYISELALLNARDLLPLILWNARHGIQLFRLSSGIFPWMTKYNMEDLPDFPEIKKALRAAGDAARAAGQRLTFHPSEYCKIAGPEDRDDWTEQSVEELEVHSKIFDLMGYEPSPWNKINIHVGGTYNDKDATLARFARVVNEKLSPNCKARLTVENDDKASLYSVKELLIVHELTGIPITFDFHHHKFCTGDWDEETAFKAAIATWPKGVRPVVHWSEAREDRPRPQAHSDYVYGPIYLHGLESEVDVMIESKAKELALLKYREIAIEHMNNLLVRSQTLNRSLTLNRSQTLNRTQTLPGLDRTSTLNRTQTLPGSQAK